jgi:excisionase family DNA binding protein
MLRHGVGPPPGPGGELRMGERKSRAGGSNEPIRNLQDHSSPYVTTSELADYWLVSRKQIYKQIEAGTLKAIRLGPRLLRVSTAEAIEFERIAKMTPEGRPDSERAHAETPDTQARTNRPHDRPGDLRRRR